MSNIHDLTEVGIIVGEASSNEFFFASRSEEYPPKWEYIVVYSKEDIDGKLAEVPVIAQVERIITSSQALSKDVDVEALKRIITAEIEDIRTWGKARILGYLIESESRILQPRRAVTPGNSIYLAPKEILQKFYSLPVDEGLQIGPLITRADVPVHLSVLGFRRHLAIIAQTGAGKSYCTGVIIEELVRNGATIIVIDPHADYTLLSLSKDDGKHEFSDRVTIFRNPASTSRFITKDVGNVENYDIAFTDLSPDEICDISRIPGSAKNIREAVREALESLKNTQYTPNELLQALENPTWALNKDGGPDKSMKSSAESATKYIRSLAKLRVFGTSSTRINKLLKPAHISIIDLSGLEDRAMNYISSKILQDVYESAFDESYEFPVFIMVEEAHKFIPPKFETYASSIINKIAAEGRKFGVFLTLITQRPSKVNPDSLSQCNSQIIMKLTNPQDQQAVGQSSERMSLDLLADLPGLNPGECIIVGEITRAPVMVKIRERMTKEGGADVNVIQKLEQARRALKEEKINSDDDIRREPFNGELS